MNWKTAHNNRKRRVKRARPWRVVALRPRPFTGTLTLTFSDSSQTEYTVRYTPDSALYGPMGLDCTEQVQAFLDGARNTESPAKMSPEVGAVAWANAWGLSHEIVGEPGPGGHFTHTMRLKGDRKP